MGRGVPLCMQGENSQERYYFAFSFFKVDPKWRWMADLAKQESAKEVENILENTNCMYRSYSTLGIRDDADFMLWFAAKTVEEIQNAVSKLYRTVFGKYIIPSRTFFSVTRPSMYAKTGLVPAFVSGKEALKYTIVYPFIKSRKWYRTPTVERQAMMDEHIAIGNKYPKVILNTTYSFGIHDEDFMLAFETDDLIKFQDLIIDLRTTRVSEYVTEDTPMIVCVKKDIVPVIQSLG
ncbi:MAG: chlorite dismutase [Cenarchaeum symbiont of Oopsacas minuta]|nr:chlorite dismutase [Cenarchaeum symbiont of Oopsacas minuta]